ncbi:carbohydrate-binding protein [Kitasatospora cineracea]|uniref:carbohydrate-binding protein n=1 Tax=Kitasatospora cineracea TaxID=88074 RepID=UPI0036D9B284
MYPAPGTSRTTRTTRTSKPAALAAAVALLAGLTLWTLAPGTARAASVVLEAESAANTGGAAVAADHAGYTGTGFVGGFTDGNKGAAKTSFTVQAATAGTATLAVRYANGTGSAKTLTLLVNGAAAGQVTLPATANWDTWATVRQDVTLNSGANTVAYAFTAADSGNVNLDSLTATTGTTGTPAPGGTLEAETAALSGGAAVAADHAGYTGTGFVGGYTDGNKGTARTAFAVTSATAGSGTADIRYANGTGSAKTLTLLVNGAAAGQVTLPATANWDTWATVRQPVTYAAGSNTLALAFTAADSGNVNLDSLTPTTPAGSTAPTDPGTPGADLPYTGYEAEAGTTNGTVLTPDRTYLAVASEASGRSAVELTRTGQYVEITLTAPADAINLRYSLPDSADGTGQDATLSAYADGQALGSLHLTSRYAWVYGAYPYTNNPADGQPHRFFDETRATLGRTLPAGTVLRFQKDAADTAASYTLDLVEAEQAGAAGPLPAGYVSAADLGVTPGTQDVTAALNSALTTARNQGKGLFLPTGTYVVSDHVDLSGAKLRGAGVWYTVLRGTGLKGGLYGTGGTSTVEDLAIDGQNTVRDDANGQAGIEGDFGTGSVIRNVWIRHTKVGLWINAPTKGLQATGLRIRDTYADGVNLHGAVDSTVVSDSSIRGTGDDALAMWSDGAAVTNSAFRHNTVQLPTLANGAAVYGGSGNSVEDNLISDTVTAGAGITVSSRFGQPFTGTTTVSGNLLRRTGSLEVNWNSRLGAIWIYADQSDLTRPVVLNDNTVQDSTYSALLLSWQKQVADLRVDGLVIDRTGHHGIEVNAGGQGTFANTRISGTADAPLNVTGGFTVQRGTGNTGW